MNKNSKQWLSSGNLSSSTLFLAPLSFAFLHYNLPLLGFRSLCSMSLDHHSLKLFERGDTLRHSIRLQTLLIHQSNSRLHYLLSNRSPCHALMPSLHVREALKLLTWRVEDQRVDSIIPHREGKISKRHLVAYEPLFALKRAVENAKYALRLTIVTLDSRWNFFLGVGRCTC